MAHPSSPGSPPRRSSRRSSRQDAGRPRIALAHDWLVARRGGELVLEAIARVAADIGTTPGVYTMFARGRNGMRPGIGPTTDALTVHASALNRLPPGLRRWMLPCYPLAVGQLSRRLQRAHDHRPFDLLISTSSAAIKAIKPPTPRNRTEAPVPHLCYCHSPARYIWSRAEDYTAGAQPGVLDRTRSLGLGLIRTPYKSWDRATSGPERITRVLANSTHTAREIERCYQRESSVVHPPVRTEFFTPDPHTARGTHWLVVSALEPYKRVDIAIRAAHIAGAELEIVGTGSAASRLRVLGERLGARIRWMGRLSDDAVRDAYRRAAVFLFPQVEDFGIVAGEALACGTPLAARHAGGAIDLLGPRCGVHYRVHDDAGTLLDDHAHAERLAEAAARAIATADADACRAHAETFSETRFAEHIAGEIIAMLESDMLESDMLDPDMLDPDMHDPDMHDPDTLDPDRTQHAMPV